MPRRTEALRIVTADRPVSFSTASNGRGTLCSFGYWRRVGVDIVSDDLRPDIAKARSLMSSKLGSGREIKELAEYLSDDETVERMVSGRYGGGVGLLVLTDRRLIFLKDGMVNKTLEDFPVDKISSVQWSSGMALGKLQIFV